MLDVGLGVRLIVGVAAAPAPPVSAPAPGKPPFPLLSSSSLRRRRSSWWFFNGNAHGRDTTTTSSRATRRRWWSDPDGSQRDYDGSSSLEEEDDYDYEDEPAFSRFVWAGELFDESWFSKVFKTYGVLLPVMLTSMFSATGLKAFLMAMAIPLSQSAISFLVRRKGNGYRSSSSNYYEGRRRRHNYKSWVSKDLADAASTTVGADDNTKSSSSSSGGGRGRNKSSGGYGGWDELLDNSTAAAQEAKRRSNTFSAGNTDYSTRSWPSATGEEVTDYTALFFRDWVRGAPSERMRMRRRRMPRTMGLGSTRYKQKQAPLLMRLLVAVFPFLGSWFRLL